MTQPITITNIEAMPPSEDIANLLTGLLDDILPDKTSNKDIDAALQNLGKKAKGSRSTSPSAAGSGDVKGAIANMQAKIDSNAAANTPSKEYPNGTPEKLFGTV